MKMRKIPVLLFTLLFIPCLLAAQKTSPVKLGLRVAPGIGWINPSTEGYNSNGIRGIISAGLISDFYFTSNYAISSGFSVIFPSGKLDYRDMRVLAVDDTVVGQFNMTYKYIYFEIPLMIKMKTNEFGKFSFYGQVGLGTGFKIKATAEGDVAEDDGTSIPVDLEISNKTRLMRESIIVGIGLEYSVDKSTKLTGGFNYNAGLNDVFNSMNLLYNLEEQGTTSFAEFSIGILF
jgi:hypothetical protein